MYFSQSSWNLYFSHNTLQPNSKRKNSKDLTDIFFYFSSVASNKPTQRVLLFHELFFQLALMCTILTCNTVFSCGRGSVSLNMIKSVACRVHNCIKVFSLSTDCRFLSHSLLTSRHSNDVNFTFNYQQLLLNDDRTDQRLFVHGQ